MASISREPNGRRTIQFMDTDGKRRSIRLGKVSQRAAEGIKVKVEGLVASKITGHALDDETARWLTTLGDDLAAVGLMPRRERATLEAFLEGYIAKRTGVDVTPATAEVWGHVKRNLVAFFGAERPLKNITAEEAEDWNRYLIGLGLAPTTIYKRLQFARMFFRAAIRAKLIHENPFAEVKGREADSNRKFFVTREAAERVLAACPDAQWRLLFALSRYGGLRCPSEHLALRWGDIDWEHNRITVTSPKTARHPGHESRIIPLFPELRPYLEEVFEQAEPGTEYVITRYRQRNCNLRTQLERIILKARMLPWPRLFHNLRASRETELAKEHPLHVVTKWIGNSTKIAAKHYLQVVEEDFQEAMKKAVQNPVQQPAVPLREPPQESGNDNGSGSGAAQADCPNSEPCGNLRPIARIRDKSFFCNDLNQAERTGFVLALSATP